MCNEKSEWVRLWRRNTNRYMSLYCQLYCTSLVYALAHVSKDKHPYLEICKEPIFVTGRGRRYDSHELESTCGIVVCCSCCVFVIMDTVCGGYLGRQETQNKWTGCRMGYTKQEGAQWTGNLLYAEGI